MISFDKVWWFLTKNLANLDQPLMKFHNRTNTKRPSINYVVSKFHLSSFLLSRACIVNHLWGSQPPTPYRDDRWFNLFQPGEKIIPTTILPAPQIFGWCGVSVWWSYFCQLLFYYICTCFYVNVGLLSQIQSVLFNYLAILSNRLMIMPNLRQLHLEIFWLYIYINSFFSYLIKLCLQNKWRCRWIGTFTACKLEIVSLM